MLTVLCKNANGLWAARFFLGFVESSIAPSMSLIISMWYKRSEQPIRQCAWFMGNVIGGLVGGLLGYGVGHIDGIPPWKVRNVTMFYLKSPDTNSIILCRHSFYFLGALPCFGRWFAGLQFPTAPWAHGFFQLKTKSRPWSVSRII